MLERHSNRRPGPSRGTTAHRIDHHHHRAAAGGKQPVDVRGSPRFLDAVLRQIRPHGSNKLFRVGHETILTVPPAQCGPDQGSRVTLMFCANSMPARVSETFVLRTYPFREADLIVSFFTRDQGKLRGVARRARRPKSPFGSGLERLSHVRMAYFQRENAELANLTGCELIRVAVRLAVRLRARRGAGLFHRGRRTVAAAA